MVELLGPVRNSGSMLYKALTHAAVTFCHLSQDSIRFFCILLKSRSALASENLFLRKQLALYQERNVPPKRATDATRLSLVLREKLFEWKGALRVVRMETFVSETSTSASGGISGGVKGDSWRPPSRVPTGEDRCLKVHGG